MTKHPHGQFWAAMALSLAPTLTSAQFTVVRQDASAHALADCFSCIPDSTTELLLPGQLNSTGIATSAGASDGIGQISLTSNAGSTVETDRLIAFSGGTAEYIAHSEQSRIQPWAPGSFAGENTAFMQLTFDVARDTAVNIEAYGLINGDQDWISISKNLSLIRLVPGTGAGPGQPVAVALPDWGTSLNATLTAGRYVMSSSFGAVAGSATPLDGERAFSGLGGLNIRAVPEPGAFMLLLAGLAAIWGWTGAGRLRPARPAARR